MHDTHTHAYTRPVIDSCFKIVGLAGVTREQIILLTHALGRHAISYYIIVYTFVRVVEIQPPKIPGFCAGLTVIKQFIAANKYGPGEHFGRSNRAYV